MHVTDTDRFLDLMRDTSDHRGSVLGLVIDPGCPYAPALGVALLGQPHADLPTGKDTPPVRVWLPSLRDALPLLQEHLGPLGGPLARALSDGTLTPAYEVLTLDAEAWKARQHSRGGRMIWSAAGGYSDPLQKIESVGDMIERGWRIPGR